MEFMYYDLCSDDCYRSVMEIHIQIRICISIDILYTGY